MSHVPRAESQSVRTSGSTHELSSIQGTTTEKALEQVDSSASSRQPYPSYPIPIPSEKFPKALKLYEVYCLQKLLADENQEAQYFAVDGSHRLETLSSGIELTSSVASRPSATDVSASAFSYGSSVANSSSAGAGSREQPEPISSTSKGEFIGFNGVEIKQRVRRPLSAKTKSKAALVRHLGSCWVCRERRVPVGRVTHFLAVMASLLTALHSVPSTITISIASRKLAKQNICSELKVPSSLTFQQAALSFTQILRLRLFPNYLSPTPQMTIAISSSILVCRWTYHLVKMTLFRKI